MSKSDTIHKPRGPKPNADHELAASADNRLKLNQIFDDYIGGLPTGGDPSFRKQVDDVMDRLNAVKDISDSGLNKIFAQVRGALSQISAKGGGNLDPEQRLIRAENASYREHALKIATEGVRIFSIPTVDRSQPEHFTLNREINQAFDGATRDRAQGMYGFVEFLTNKLTDKKQDWNSVNIVTALYKMCNLDPQWPSRPFGQAIGSHLIDKLVTVADRYIFDGHSVCNIAEQAPALIEVLNRMQPKDPILEKRLFGALGKAVQYTKEMPEEAYADKSFLYPLRDISSRYLSHEGAAALCAYVAKLNHLFSQMSYSRHTGTVATTFHAINGVSAWAQNPDSDAKLTIMLKNLNDRLERSALALDSVSASSIIYGLKGLDVRNLSNDAVEQVARTIRLVTDKLNALPPGFVLDHKAVSSITHGLTLALQEKEGPVARATVGLIKALDSRLPPEIRTLDELGAFCGALITLRPHIGEHRQLARTMLDCAVRAATSPLEFQIGTRSSNVAWEVTQQAFALYRQKIPEQLHGIIDRMAPTIVNSSTPSRSEARVREWARNHPGVVIDRTQYIDGFQLDLLVNNNINIEVDGGHHLEPAKVLADNLRDQYLSHNPHPGLRIIRVPSNISREEFDQIISQALAENRSSIGR